MNCKKRCNRRLECGHPCTELCCLPCKSECACDKEFWSAHCAATLTGSPEDTHAAPFSYAEAATGSFKKIKTSPSKSQAEAPIYTTVFNGSPKRKRMLRDSSQFSGSPQLEDRPPYRDIPHDTQPYVDYAAGRHVESDKALAALGEREAAEARGKQLDEENFAVSYLSEQNFPFSSCFGGLRSFPPPETCLLTL